MRVAKEETFGPVAPLFRFETEDDVIEMANDTEFGLASYFYAKDFARVFRVADHAPGGDQRGRGKQAPDKRREWPLIEKQEEIGQQRRQRGKLDPDCAGDRHPASEAECERQRQDVGQEEIARMHSRQKERQRDRRQ